MSILQNAIDSIAIGLEDFYSGDQRRLISSTRNVFAGILLLFKHKLVLMSPTDSDEVLIKQKISPFIGSDHILKWIGKGHKTVDVSQIQDRFRALEIPVDWKSFDEINIFRNEIEHYYSSLSENAIETLIARSFLIIRDFVVNVLKEEPRILLGQETWDAMVKIANVYTKEQDECIAKLELLDWKTDILANSVKQFKCTQCGSNLITLDGEPEIFIEDNIFSCRSCGEEYTFENILKESLDQCYGYYDYRGGEEPSLVDCPFCGEYSYVYNEGKCASCGESAEQSCIRCGSNITSEEISDGSLCSYCQYLVDKDD